MNLNALRAFHAVAANAGFRRAAEKLGVTQPAVTAQVQALEARYGVELFVRKGRGVQPTELGRELMDGAERLFALEGDLDELLRSAGRLDRGTLRLGADNPFAAMPLIGGFMAAHPGVALRVTMGNTASTLADVLEGRTDTAVLTYPQRLADLADRPIRADRLVLLLPADHPWRAQAEISLAALAGIPVIGREQGSGTRLVLDAALDAAGVVPRVILELGSREALREAVAAGLGVGVTFASELVEDARLIARPLRGKGLEVPVCLVARAERRQLRTIRAVFALVSAS